MKIRKILLIIIAISTLVNKINAQKQVVQLKSDISCKDFVNWKNNFDKNVEYTSLNNNLIHNLLSDRYFLPYFGKSYYRLDWKKQDQFHALLKKCNKGEKILESKFFNYGGNKTYGSSQVSNKQRELDKIELMLNKLDINTYRTQISDCKGLLNQLLNKNNDYRLLPQDIEKIDALFQSKEVEISEPLLAKFNEIKTSITAVNSNEDLIEIGVQSQKFFGYKSSEHYKIMQFIRERRVIINKKDTVTGKNKSDILLAQEEKYFDENVKKRAYDKNLEWELIFKDKQTEYYLRLGTPSGEDEREATFIAVHDIKDENTPLYAYKKVYGNAFKLEESVIEYLYKTLLPKAKIRLPDVNILVIRNFIKDVHISSTNWVKWKREYEGELIKITIASYLGGNGPENTPGYHLDYEYAMTLKDAKELREKLKKNPISWKEREYISKRVSDYEEIDKTSNVDLSIEIEKSKKAAHKPGFVYYDDGYWNDYGKYSNGTIILEREVFRNTFHGNFTEVKYLFWKEQNSKNIWEAAITQNASVNFVSLLSSFVLNYSSQCREFLPADHDVLNLTSKSVDQFGNQIGASLNGGKVYIDKRFTSIFQTYYPTYADTFRKALYNDTANFIKKNGCDCKSVVQLTENLLRYAEGRKSIQQSAESIKGKKCD